MYLRTIAAIVGCVVVWTPQVEAAFTGCYAPDQWTFYSDGDESNQGSGALTTDQMTVLGMDGQHFYHGLAYYSVTACADAMLSFHWVFASEDQDEFDRAMYRINGGEPIFIGNWVPGEGDLQVAVSAGDVFDLGVWTEDALTGPGTLVVTQFVPEPSALLMLLPGLLLVSRRRRTAV
ncbi:MAG TPA: PEP-CTERM sorting domain-containing protein [Phycisphaerae bacterium]|nr:PEP-CTERM sorting domain-containing protein [Phycisphaerae bacterium]HNU46727.1 PEP-CTERM sorting domain-containing protein [Phycisphaerae bacterium]